MGADIWLPPIDSGPASIITTPFCLHFRFRRSLHRLIAILTQNFKPTHSSIFLNKRNAISLSRLAAGSDSIIIIIGGALLLLLGPPGLCPSFWSVCCCFCWLIESENRGQGLPPQCCSSIAHDSQKPNRRKLAELSPPARGLPGVKKKGGGGRFGDRL